jgi:cation:H+ antiporter
VILHLPLLILGLVFLAYFADLFVVGVAEVSTRLRISTVVTGALIIGFGTSAPELVVSTVSAMEEDAAGTSLAMGNIVGSNVANLTLMLAIPILVWRRPIEIAPEVQKQAKISFLAVLAFALLVLFAPPHWGWGILLLFLWVLALYVIVRMRDRFGGKSPAPTPGWIPWAQTTGGLVGTVVTAYVVVKAATVIAEDLGWSGGFVGFGIVAVGTSLPELVTALAAVRRNESGLVVGNLLGSNLFNSLLVGGSVFLVSGRRPYDGRWPLPWWWIVAMVLVSVLAVGFKVSGERLVKLEAWILLVVYASLLTAMAVTGTMR